MEELISQGYRPYLYLDNPEILLKDPQSYYRPVSLNKKVNKTCVRIRRMIASGLATDEIIDQSVEIITDELRPSRFGYVCAVIASEFPQTFIRWVKTNALTDQVLELLTACEPVFSLLKFNVRTVEQHRIYLTVTSFIRHYLKRKRSESVPLSPVAKIKDAVVTTAFAVEAQSSTQYTELQQTVAVMKGQPAVTTASNVIYFKSELLEKSFDITQQAPTASGIWLDDTKPSKKTLTMASKQYLINKGINKSLVFKGLKAQYIGYMGLGLLIDLLFYAVLYMCKVNTYITLLLTAALGAIITMTVYHLNARYGEHGLGKSLAKRKTPKIIRSFSRRIFR